MTCLLECFRDDQRHGLIVGVHLRPDELRGQIVLARTLLGRIEMRHDMQHARGRLGIAGVDALDAAGRDAGADDEPVSRVRYAVAVILRIGRLTRDLAWPVDSVERLSDNGLPINRIETGGRVEMVVGHDRASCSTDVSVRWVSFSL